MRNAESGRRQVLFGGLGASAWLLAGRPGLARAQSAALLGAPKLALVVGNGAYRQEPLKNPANDARAMQEALGQTGFGVTLVVDAGRDAMLGAIQGFTRELARKKAVGLFYFAGHGVQLSWRNYLIPVDAVIDTPEDVQRKAVAVAGLLEALSRAGNPMNVIVLDACRDNPFGREVRIEQKGLGQTDAPPGTLLAYATAPGHVASDGEGANGLYTEHLLKEVRVPEAKIEDTFKRVRLGVRRRSQGRQVPWESTSLEEDFYFVPPPGLKKLSDEEVERRFQAELALWEQVKDAREPAPLEDYLRRHPSGEFAELAQAHLDRVLARQGEQKIQVVTSEQNPFSKGSAVANLDHRVGDSRTYRALDLFSKQEQRQFTETVVQVTDGEVVYDSGLVIDLLGNVLRTRDGRRFSASKATPLEFTVGKRWMSRFEVTRPDGSVGTTTMRLRIATRESVKVPAGTFNAFRIEAKGVTVTPRGPIDVRFTMWLAPDRIRGPVAREELRAPRFSNRTLAAVRLELVSYTQA
jgi:hypothetical protein